MGILDANVHLSELLTEAEVLKGTTTSEPNASKQTERPVTGISVCIVVENLPVPTDRRVWSEACALRDAGYLVSVICPKGKKSATSSYEILEGIHIYRHRTWEAQSAIGYLWEYTLALLVEFYLVFKV